MYKYIGVLGIFAILGIAYLLSNNKNKIDKKVVLWGLSLQIFFALLILKVPGGKWVFDLIDSFIKKILSFSVAGSKFLFGNLAVQEYFYPGIDTWPGFGFQFAFVVLPTVIFFSSVMSVLYHFGVMQKVIKFISRIMQKTMGTSGAETTSISANIFVGQTEAPLVIRPFINKMTNSELMSIMTGGFATVAGGVMAAYVLMLNNTIPGIAGHLMAASIMSAPAALVIAKIIYPETSTPETVRGDVEIAQISNEENFLEALGNGATEGIKLAINIAAMLVAFISVIAMVNWTLSLIPFGSITLSIEMILGYLFMPLAFLMGAPWSEAHILGSLMGQKLVLTEFIAYDNLASQVGLSERTATIAAYALCGFANFASVGIQLGGIGSIVPERKKDLAKIVTKAMLGGALASWLTATIAGILI